MITNDYNELNIHSSIYAKTSGAPFANMVQIEYQHG